MEHIRTYRIEGMDCAHCAETIEKGVRRLEGVRAASVNLATATLTLDGEVPRPILADRVKALGYTLADEITASSSRRETQEDKGGLIGFARFLLKERTTRFALAGGALILAGVLALLLGAERVAEVLFVAATLAALLPIAHSGLNNLRINRDFNINLLMTIACIGALLIGETFEGAVVVFLFAVGEALEGYATDRARRSIHALMTLVPASAVRLVNGTEETVPVETLAVGDMILVRPGERIPMDGIVMAGESAVDQAPVTGESIPVHKAAGAVVYAGTVNGDGALEIRVTHLAADNTINRIIRLVEEAQNVRAPSQRVIDQFARWYTPAVTVLAALVAVLPPLLLDVPFYDTPEGHGSLYRALSLLVIACPCALVISTPVTVISAITAAARRGVLIKGGAHLEMLGRVRAIAFDKTGTLTHGQPAVTLTRADDCDSDDHASCDRCDDVLALAAAVERRSAHPLAKAVMAAAEARGVAERYTPASAVQTLAGRGLIGQVNGHPILIGSHTLFDQQHPHSADLCAQAHKAEREGRTTMLLSQDDRVRGFIAVEDQVRPESAAVIAALRAQGLHTTMLTGDHADVAVRVQQRVGVDEVCAELLPQNKVEAVRALQRTYGAAAMVGDGINDTPALAAAAVGIAMGGAGSAQALETSDIALMADDLRGLPFAVRLARFTRRLIRQNVIISFGIKALFVALALGGFTSLWAAILADVGTSLIVTLNGMRPLRSAQE